MSIQGWPLRNVYAADGAIVSLGAASIMTGAKQPNAARLLLEFLLSAEGDDLRLSVCRRPKGLRHLQLQRPAEEPG